MTGQASKVARGLRTIGNNIADTANKTGELSYSVDETTKSISLLDEATGDMRSTYDVLGDIATDWDRMSASEQQAIAISLAGKNQFEVFGAVLGNFDNAIKATSTALNSSGSAAKENADFMESLQAKINDLKAQFQELVLGDGGLTSFIKILIETGTEILKFANSDLGQAVIQGYAVIGVMALLNKAISGVGKLFINAGTKAYAMSKGMTAATAATAVAEGSWVSAGVALKSLTVAFLKSPLAITTVVIAGIIGIKSAVDALTESEEEQAKKLKETNEEYENLQGQVESLQTQLDTINKKIEDINSLDGAQTVRDGELEELIAQREELETKIALLKEEQEIKARESYSTAIDSLGNTVQSKYDKETQTKYAGYGVGRQSYEAEIGKEILPYEELNNAVNAMKNYQTEIDNTRAEMDKLRASGETDSQAFRNLQQSLSDTQSKLNDTRSYAKDLADGLEDQKEAIDNVENGYEDLDDAQKDIYRGIDDSLDGYKDFTKELGDTEDALEDTGDEAEDTGDKMHDLGIYSSDSMNSMNEATKEQQDVISSLASDIDNITSAYQTAVDAAYEYNQQGYLSVDTYSQLMQLAPEYLAMMINENGQLYANADAVTTAYQAKVYLMGIEAAEAQVSLASSMAANQGAGAYAALGSQAINTAGSLWELVKARMADKIAAVEDPADLAALENRINAINDLTQSTIANAKATTSSIRPTNATTGATNKNTGANKGNTGSRKSNTNAIKAQTEALKAQKEALEKEADALEDEIDDYETVIDYVKDLLKEEQEAVEEEKDTQLEAIQDKIDALEEEQEAFEENIEAQIDALEKQKDETEEYWDAQIDAIENANDALEENMELQKLQEALANAKSQKVKVLKNGRFIYAEDEEAISKAEQELADYEMQLSVQRQIEELERLKEEALDSLEDQIQKLEDYRDKQNKNYEQQLKDLQNHYDAVEAEYDYRIKQYDGWLKQFEDMLEASSRRHAEILYNELVGEQGNWDARIVALGDFVNRYEQKKNQLDGIKSEIEAIDNQIKALQARANNSIGVMNARLGEAQGLQNQIASFANSRIPKARYYVYSGNGKAMYATQKYDDWRNAQSDAFNWENRNAPMLGDGHYAIHTTEYYAKGTYSTPEDQIALVADPIRPSNRELVVGSKINEGDGVLTSLKKGTGVIPAGRNLTENLINLARWSQNGGFERTFTTMNQSSSKIIHIENINLPEVHNPEDFVSYLEKNFVNDSIQFANVRR